MLFKSEETKKIERAQIEISQLFNAIIKCAFENKQFPIVTATSDRQYGRDLLTVLVGGKWTNPYDGISVPADKIVEKLNPKLVNYLAHFTGKSLDHPLNAFRTCYVDPWGEPYNFAIDTNGDGIIEIHGQSYAHKGGSLIEEYILRIGQPVAIWSNGPNLRDDLGLGDDIASWKFLSRVEWPKLTIS